jgi:acyl-coenzyme A thioesterase PaaI-like protein
VDSACGYAALTQAPAGMEVVTAEFKINLMRPGIGDHFLAIAKVQSAGRLLTVCTGEVRAYQNPSWAGTPDSPHKLIALMQATIVNVAA